MGLHKYFYRKEQRRNQADKKKLQHLLELIKNAYAILNFDAKDDLKNIKCPTLIIAGADDKTVGDEALYLLEEGILGSEIFIYEGLGHGTFEEANDFYDRVYEFCERK